MRRLLLMGAAAAVLGVGACGSEDTGDSTQPAPEGQSNEGGSQEAVEEESAPSGVEVLDSGFGQQDVYVSPVAQIQASPEDAGRFATVTFNLLDESGELLATTEQVEQVTGDGLEFIAGFEEVDGQVASVETTVSLDEGDALDVVTDLEVESVDSTGSAVVINPTGEIITDVRVTVACFDGDGQIIGGGAAFPSQVPANGQIKADPPTVELPAESSSCEGSVYATPF